MLNLNGCGDRVDVDQLLHISLICVPQVVLASHAKCSQKCVKVEKKDNLWVLPAIGEVTIGCRVASPIFGGVRVGLFSLDIHLSYSMCFS